MYSGQLFAGRKECSKQRKVSYHGSQPFKFRPITVTEAHPPHNTFAGITSAWCSRSICLRDRRIDSFISAVYLLFTVSGCCRWMYDIFKMADNGGGG